MGNVLYIHVLNETNMKKTYVLAPYRNGFAMYEADDFRLDKLNPKRVGTFKRVKSVKGLFNGHEIGIFTTDDNTEYLVFSDHSARLLKEVEEKAGASNDVKTEKSETEFFTLMDVVRGYLALTYSCAIISEFQSHQYPSFTHIGADGFPVITYKEFDCGTGLPQYWLMSIAGTPLINDARILYSLHEIREIFKADLRGMKIIPKNVDEAGNDIPAKFINQ